jgi:glyoxylase-like metal-dependent hydrolase (beta-lactamase superfamily II)
MIQIQSFTFSPIQENTYVLYDDSGECLIIDPGCYDEREREKLSSFIDDKKLKPVRLLNTHCHLDHIFGNGYVSSKYNLKPEFNENDLRVFEAFAATCDLYGMNCDPSPPAGNYLNEGDIVKFGNSSLEIFFTPGHSPGSITFYNQAEKFMIAGDVLFYGSIGRTDLPGGNFDTLINSITTKLFSLGDDFKVYSGHGPATSIGFERKNNPFLK